MSSLSPSLISVRYFTTPSRPQPRLGDLRTTKKHGEQVRIPEVVQMGPHRGAWVVRGNRQCYEWVSYDEARKRGFGGALDRALSKKSTKD